MCSSDEEDYNDDDDDEKNDDNADQIMNRIGGVLQDASTCTRVVRMMRSLRWRTASFHHKMISLPPSLALSHKLAQLVAYVKLVEVLHSSLSLNGRCTDVAVDDEAAGDDGYDG